MMIHWLIPVLNAFFGWSVIATLQWVVFHPKNKVRLLIVDIQGIIPKYLPEWKSQLAELASSFINISELKEKVLQDDNKEAIRQMLEKKVDDFLENKLKEKMPMLSMFFTEGLRKQVRNILMEELMNMLPAVMNQVASHAEERLNIPSLVRQKLEMVTADLIEKEYKKYAAPSMRNLQIFFAAAGFLLGIVELAFLS